MELTITRESDGASFAFDVVESGTFNHDAIIPEHPIDPGIGLPATTVITNVQPLLDKFSYKVRVSAMAPNGITDTRREESAREFLRSSWRQLLVVRAPRRGPVRNVLLASWPHSLTAKLSTPFDLAFVVAEFGNAETVFLPRIVKRAKPDTTPPVDDGEVPFEGPLPPEKTPPGSFLKSIFG